MKKAFLSVWPSGGAGRCLPRHSFWRPGVSLGAAAILFLAGGQSASAAETNEVQALRQQLQQLQENFERVQREQKQQIDELTRKLNELTGRSAAEAEKKKLEQELAAELTTNTPAASAPAAQPTPTPAWSPSQPLTIARAGNAYMNLSFDALIDAGWSTASDPAARLQLGDHDPINRGFSLRNAELVLDGAVDPYLKGFANIVFKLDQNNETSVELEETYLQTSDLPLNLQARAGQFFANFGRQNPQHPHQWAFVDEPIILNRAFGPDGLRNIGAQVSWLAPLPFYTEASLGIFNGEGGTAFSFRNNGMPDLLGVNRQHEHNTFSRSLRGPGDLLYVPRLAASFDLTDHQTLLAGVSASFGPNATGSDSRTEVYGVDLYWKWKSPTAHAGFPFASLQAEALYQRFGAGAGTVPNLPGIALPAENLRDWGFYAQALWGFRERWVAGLRGEFASGNQGLLDAADIYRGDRTRVSPNLTFYPSEFSKIRLQYNYDQGEYFGTEHSVWMQLEFLLGAHAAHKF